MCVLYYVTACGLMLSHVSTLLRVCITKMSHVI